MTAQDSNFCPSFLPFLFSFLLSFLLIFLPLPLTYFLFLALRKKKLLFGINFTPLGIVIQCCQIPVLSCLCLLISAPNNCLHILLFFIYLFVFFCTCEVKVRWDGISVGRLSCSVSYVCQYLSPIITLTYSGHEKG